MARFYYKFATSEGNRNQNLVQLSPRNLFSRILVQKFDPTVRHSLPRNIWLRISCSFTLNFHGVSGHRRHGGDQINDLGGICQQNLIFNIRHRRLYADQEIRHGVLNNYLF